MKSLKLTQINYPKRYILESFKGQITEKIKLMNQKITLDSICQMLDMTDKTLRAKLKTNDFSIPECYLIERVFEMNKEKFTE